MTTALVVLLLCKFFSCCGILPDIKINHFSSQKEKNIRQKNSILAFQILHITSKAEPMPTQDRGENFTH